MRSMTTSSAVTARFSMLKIARSTSSNTHTRTATALRSIPTSQPGGPRRLAARRSSRRTASRAQRSFCSKALIPLISADGAVDSDLRLLRDVISATHEEVTRARDDGGRRVGPRRDLALDLRRRPELVVLAEYHMLRPGIAGGREG